MSSFWTKQFKRKGENLTLHNTICNDSVWFLFITKIPPFKIPDSASCKIALEEEPKMIKTYKGILHHSAKLKKNRFVLKLAQTCSWNRRTRKRLLLPCIAENAAEICYRNMTNFQIFCIDSKKWDFRTFRKNIWSQTNYVNVIVFYVSKYLFISGFESNLCVKKYVLVEERWKSPKVTKNTKISWSCYGVRFFERAWYFVQRLPWSR